MKKGQKRLYAQNKFSFWLVVAVVMHAAVLFGTAFLQIWNTGNHVKQKMVSVTLVSLPGSRGGTQEFSEEQGGAETIPVQPLTKPIPAPAVKQTVQSPDVSKSQPQQPHHPKIAEKKPSASKSSDSQLQKALEHMQQLVDKKTASPSRPSSVTTLNKALSQLQQKVKLEGEQGVSGNRSMSGGKGAAGKGVGSGGASGSYTAAVASIIQRNWDFSQTLLKNNDRMKVYVRINILPDGTIVQILFDRKAVSEYLNNSVKKAIEKSSPLPVFPKEEGARDIWISFAFSPKGIEQ